jgi:hypothetical protein
MTSTEPRTIANWSEVFGDRFRPKTPCAEPQPDPHAETIRRIGAACTTCRGRLADAGLDDATAAAIEDCRFISQSSCVRRRAIRDGTAVCPLGRWTLA